MPFQARRCLETDTSTAAANLEPLYDSSLQSVRLSLTWTFVANQVLYLGGTTIDD